MDNEYTYLVGFHEDGGFTQEEMTFTVPVHLGENIIDNDQEGEWKVFQITHETEYSILHVNQEI
jgi:hypothetical protein